MTDGVNVNGAGRSTPTPYSTDTTDKKDEEGVEANLGPVKRNIKRFEGGPSQLKRSSRPSTEEPQYATPKKRKLQDRKSSKTDAVKARVKPPLKPKPTLSPEQAKTVGKTNKEATPKGDVRPPVGNDEYDTLQHSGKKTQNIRSKRSRVSSEERAAILAKENQRTDYATLQHIGFKPTIPISSTSIPVYESIDSVFSATPSEPLYVNANASSGIYESLHFPSVYENVDMAWKNDSYKMKAFVPRKSELPEQYQAFWPRNKALAPPKPKPFHETHGTIEEFRKRKASFRTDAPATPPVSEATVSKTSLPQYETIPAHTETKPQQPETRAYDYQKLQTTLESFINKRVLNLRIGLTHVPVEGSSKKQKARKKAQEALTQLEAKSERIANTANQLKAVTSNPDYKMGRKDVIKLRKMIKRLNEQLLPVVKAVHGNDTSKYKLSDYLLPVPPKPGRR